MEELPGLPLHTNVDFCIELHPDTSPISMMSYRMAPVKLQKLRVQLQELLNRGFIIPSTSSWGAPVLFSKNKDKTLQLCIDYRQFMWRPPESDPTRLVDPNQNPGDARPKPSIKFIYQIHFININVFVLKSLRKIFQFWASP